jgi:hypothetical protein
MITETLATLDTIGLAIIGGLISLAFIVIPIATVIGIIAQLRFARRTRKEAKAIRREYKQSLKAQTA